jgi:hypothetical protein
VVDIGGAQGHIALELARRFENLDIVVQDMDEVIQNLTLELSTEVNGRIRFMAHNFFSPQGVNADVYYFRWILHN